jgi:hypothetical protein
MGLEVYYPKDILNALLAAEQASSTALMAASQQDDEFAKGYREGYRAALTTIALAFGLISSDHHCESHNWQPTLLPVSHRRNGEGRAYDPSPGSSPGRQSALPRA